MNYAILDIGSNTIKMTIFSEEGEILLRKSTAAGLISYVKNGILTEEGITLLADIMLQYDKIARNTGADRLYPFATASLRAASNHQEVIDEIEKRTSYRIDLVSGEEEAALSYYGVCKTLPDQKDAMILLDIGGGSCEIVAPQCSLAVSLPVGALAMYVKFVKNILPTKNELKEIYLHTQTLAKDAGITQKNDTVCATGGSLRAFCRFHAHVFHKDFTTDSVYLITRQEIVQLLSRVTDMDLETKLTLIRLLPERTHTFATALTAILAILDTLGATTLTVVAGGAREGYFMKIKQKDKQI
ncbi:MAG: hypothetical protein IKM34_02025 [Clostridia bacterium]|nr:hypothetical protein [Clostridia bacterium]